MHHFAPLPFAAKLVRRVRCSAGSLLTIHARQFLVVVGWLAMAASARAQVTGSVTTIRGFNGVNGRQSQYPLVEGNDGYLYGTTATGGANWTGTIFRVAPDGTLTLLHTFVPAVEGGTPECALLLASDGYFYGTTSTGGPNGGGTVFRATADGTVTVLHAFGAPGDVANGKLPRGGLVRGRDGNFYGTTTSGGLNNDGTVFRLTPDGGFTTFYTFTFHQTAAGPASPSSPPVLGRDGNFYGVAAGGDNAAGTIYKLTPDGVVTTLHSFNGADGADVPGPLVEGEDGVFYGVVVGNGGITGYGTGKIYKITSDGQLTVLRVFTGANFDGSYPNAGLVRGVDGNLYGTTHGGGTLNQGNVFQITPAGVMTTIYSFGVRNVDSGTFPGSALVLASDGSFYGTTQSGGAGSNGVVYRMVLHPHPPFFDGETDLGSGVEYLAFPNGNYFGYYAFLSDPHYLYHFDLGYEYVFDTGDGQGGVYLYDFKSNGFFYTSPAFPFPYLYDFRLSTVLYYFPDPHNPGRYNTDGNRYFYNFATGKVISK